MTKTLKTIAAASASALVVLLSVGCSERTTQETKPPTETSQAPAQQAAPPEGQQAPAQPAAPAEGQQPPAQQ